MQPSFFIYFIEALSKIQIQNQTFYFSDIESDVIIRVPRHCFFVGYPCATDSKQVGTKFTLFKPLRKMHEYEYNIERGIEIEKDIYDSINYPDFSSQAVGIALSGILLSLLYKLFALE